MASHNNKGNSNATSSSTTTSKVDLERARRARPFQQLFRYLWPSMSYDDLIVHDDENSPPAKLLKFLEMQGVTDLRGLAKFDATHLEKCSERNGYELFGDRELTSKLGLCCEYISIHGVKGDSGFLALFQNHRGKIAKPMQSALEEYLRCNNLDKNMPDVTQSVLQYIPLGVARDWLDEMFGRYPLSFDFEFAIDIEASKGWLEIGQLWLLEHHSVLAREKFTIENNRYSCYPATAFLLFGCDKVIVKKVLDLFPEALHEDTDNLQDIISDGAYNVKFPLTTFQLLLELNPAIAAPLLLEKLFSRGYDVDVLNCVSDFLPHNISNVSFSNRDIDYVLDMEQAELISKTLPKTRELSIDIEAYTPSGFSTLLTRLRENLERTRNLQHLILTLPGLILGSSKPSPQDFLAGLLSVKNSSINRLFFYALDTCGWKILVWGMPYSERASAFQVLADGLTAAFKKKACQFELLTFFNMYIDESSLVDNLFSEDVFGSLDIQIQRPHPSSIPRHYCAPWPYTEKSKAIRVDQLNLFQCWMRRECWTALWKKMPGLTNLVNLRLLPWKDSNIGMKDVSVDWMEEALKHIPSLPNLRTFILGPHNDDRKTIDITDPIVRLLEGTLEVLRVDGNRANESLCYTINMDVLSASLQRNRSLKSLFLRFVQVEGARVTRSLLNVLQNFNASARIMEIYDDTQLFTLLRDPMTILLMRDSVYSYDRWEDARRLDYYLILNRSGRDKVQNTSSTTIKDLVDLLVKVRTCSYTPGIWQQQEVDFFQKLRSQSFLVGRDLNQCYELLRKDPEVWCFAIDRVHVRLSLQYDLLREAPDLWCNVARNNEGSSPRKRRRLSA